MSKHHRNTTTRDHHRRIIAQSKPNCWICGEPIDYTLKYPHPRCYVVDHKIALTNGGPDTLDNKAAAHHQCNSTKRARAYAPIIRRSGALN